MASILETFLILFESDAQKVKKDADAAGVATKNLEERIGLANKATDKLGEGFHHAVREIAAAAIGLIAVGASIHGIMQATEAAAQLNDMSEALGVNIEDLDAWEQAVKRTGGTAGGFENTLSNLSAAAAQLDATGKSRLSPFFRELGISMTDAQGKARPNLDLLTDIAGAFEHLTKAEAIGFGQKLGIDDGTVRLLQKGKTEMQELIKRQRELGVVTKEQGEVANNFNNALFDLRRALSFNALEIGAFVLPKLTSLFNSLTEILISIKSFPEWLGKNSQQLADLGRAALMVSAVIALAFLPAIVTAIAELAAMIPAAAAAAVAFAPFLLWGAALGALVLVIADIIDGLNGIDSVSGRVADVIIRKWNVMIGIFKDAWQWLNDIGNALKNLQIGALDFIGGKITGALEAGRNAIGFADSAPISAQTTNSITNGGARSSNNTVSIGKVEVQTQATDADGIAAGMTKGLERHMSQTVNALDDGIRG